MTECSHASPEIKKGASVTRPSEQPRPRGEQNSARPTPPFRGRGPAPLLFFESREAPAGRFARSSDLTLAPVSSCHNQSYLMRPPVQSPTRMHRPGGRNPVKKRQTPRGSLICVGSGHEPNSAAAGHRRSVGKHRPALERRPAGRIWRLSYYRSAAVPGVAQLAAKRQLDVILAQALRLSGLGIFAARLTMLVGLVVVRRWGGSLASAYAPRWKTIAD